MQVISVSNSVQELCEKLTTVAVLNFFDSIEVSSETMSCIKDGNTVFRYVKSGGIVYCKFFNNEPECTLYRSVTQNDCVSLIVATEKSIYLRNWLGNGTGILIAKDTEGNLIFVSKKTAGQSQLSPFTAGDNSVIIFREGGNTERIYYMNDDEALKKSYFVPLLVDGGVFADDVYLGLVRPYPSDTAYIDFTLNNTEYVGFSGTSLIVKA